MTANTSLSNCLSINKLKHISSYLEKFYSPIFFANSFSLMKKNIIYCLFLLFVCLPTSFAVAQRFGYINSQVILNKMPQYKEAQQELDKTALGWQQEIDTLQQQLGRMRRDFEAEKVLLTEDMQQKRLTSLTDKEDEVRKLQTKYFGFDGLLFKKKDDLLKNIQDKVFDAAKKVAKKRKIHFIFDKASDLSMIYTDDTYNFTDDVLQELGLGNANIKTIESKGDGKASDGGNSREDNTIGTDEKNNPPSKSGEQSRGKGDGL
jgi:outer membrane protein